MSVLDNHYFIADLHLGHGRMLAPEYDNRPFATIEEHDRALRDNCAALGDKSSTLWLLGDVAISRQHLIEFMETVQPRWQRVILIRGNHDDRVAWRLRELFSEAHEAHYMRARNKTDDIDVRVYLSHYAHRTWRNSHRGSYHLHGHSHGALKRWGRSMDVGANCVGYKPISLAEVVEQLKDQHHVNHH